MALLNTDEYKLYYSMGEVVELFDSTPSQIRYWDSEFAIINPKKNKKGNRLFTKEDVANFALIHQLLKEEGYTIEGAKKRLKAIRQETKRNAAVVSKLQKIRSELLKIQKEL